MNRFVFLFFLLCASTSVFAQTDIRKVDFKNFTYPAYCMGDKPDKITVKSGAYSYEKQEDGYVDRFSFDVRAIAYGDVNGDKLDEAMILTNCNGGGTGQFSEGFVYGIKAGKPVLLTHIPGGDRAEGGLRQTRAENGMLVVESNAMSDLGGLCCPEFIVTTKYKIVVGKLVQQGKPVKEPIDRAERVRFEIGKSGSMFKAFVPGSDAKKFVVGARAGQTLTVTVVGEHAGVRLITSAEHNEDEKSFRALLPNNGAYVFEVTNSSATEDEITVTVRIQ